jgi:hypothetical protein
VYSRTGRPEIDSLGEQRGRLGSPRRGTPSRQNGVWTASLPLSRIPPPVGRPVVDSGLRHYLCLVYYDEKKLEALSRSELDALVGEPLAYDGVLRKSGHYIVSDALQSVQTATTVRIRNGKVSTTDGPFAETKEQLGGFILIEAKDLNDAIRVASKIPPARLGCIEVRPIMELEQP